MRTGATWKWGSATALLLCVCLSGCAGTGNDNTTIPASAQVDNYVGTSSSFDSLLAGVWGMRVDHSTNYFNLNDTGYDGASPINFIGTLSTAGPFELFNSTYTNYPVSYLTSFYALEVPGDVAILGSAQVGVAPAPTVFAESNSCQAVAGATTYQLIQLGPGIPGITESYGTITVNRGQSDWTFSNFDLLQVDGTDNKPAALSNGACAQATEGFVTTIPVTVAGQPITYTVAISPNGYFIMDRDEIAVPSQNLKTPLGPLVGVAQPSSPLNTSSLMAANYAGFEYDGAFSSPQVSGTNLTDQPISFSGSNATQTQMVGGTFPKGDPTQMPSADISVNLGTQDPKNNGLYPAAAVTFPDPTSECASTPNGGTDASGNPICTLQAVAVAGDPNGKFVLYLTVLNPFGRNAPSTIQFLLYQQ
jgi:hypothetical protein